MRLLMIAVLAASAVTGIRLFFAVVPEDRAKNSTWPGQATSRAPSKAVCHSTAAIS